MSIYSGLDPDTNRQAVKYAIRITGETQPIWCSRRQLSIKEGDAKKLRAEYQPPVAIKAGDVSLGTLTHFNRQKVLLFRVHEYFNLFL